MSHSITTRYWPMPKPGEPDLIIRDPGRRAALFQRAAKGPFPQIAADALNNHCIAVASMADLAAVLDGYMRTRECDQPEGR